MACKLEFNCQTLLKNFIVKRQTFQTLTLLYLKLVVDLQLWFRTKRPKSKERKLGPFQNKNVRSGSGRTRNAVLLVGLCASSWKLATYQYRTWDNFYIQNLPAQSLLFPLVGSREWSHLLDSEKNWFLDLAYVDKLAKDKNCVRYLLVHQDLFDRTVAAKRMKTKVSKETVRSFLTMITKKIWPTKVWVDKGTEATGDFWKICEAEWRNSNLLCDELDWRCNC